MSEQLDQLIGLIGLIAWACLAYRAGIFTRTQNRLRDWLESVAHGALFGALLVLTVKGLPELPERTASQHNTSQRQHHANDAGRITVPMQFEVAAYTFLVRVINPLPKSYQAPAQPKQDQRFLQVRIVAQGSGGTYQRNGKHRQCAVPLVGTQSLQLIHSTTP